MHARVLRRLVSRDAVEACGFALASLALADAFGLAAGLFAGGASLIYLATFGGSARG